jgi:hypothetical protein
VRRWRRAVETHRPSDVLYRGPGLPALANTVARVLREAGYVLEEQPTSPHPDKVRSFERAAPNQLWQTDLFIFMLLPTLKELLHELPRTTLHRLREDWSIEQEIEPAHLH